ncbi:MAG TPA: dipeptide epimerase [Polyangiaceae bacterium]|nr:dipeptide epimerase [Polyangiaceae bacterium]
MAVTSIASIDSRVLELELTEPFGIAGGSQDIAAIVLVRLELDDGTVGWGEAAPLPAYNGERVEQALAAVEAARPRLVGTSARAWRQRAFDLREPTRASASARCALETALVDALARQSGMSLHEWFGGRAPARLVTDVTIPIVPPESARQAAARWWSLGFRSLKVKIGRDADLERLLAVHAGAPAASLVLDANGGLRAAEALELLDALEAKGLAVALFEQPVAADDWAGLERVASRVRVALDESVVTARDAAEAARRLGAPHAINVKLMKSGIVEALDIVATARAGGMSLMIGGMLESSLAMSASACFAAGLGGFEFVDLDTPLFMSSSPFVGGFALSADQIDVAVITRGHGVVLASERDELR